MYMGASRIFKKKGFHVRKERPFSCAWVTKKRMVQVLSSPAGTVEAAPVVPVAILTSKRRMSGMKCPETTHN